MPNPHYTVKGIIEAASRVTNVDAKSITGPSRLRHLVRIRQAAYYVARQRTGQSYPQIGLRFNGRNHSTIMHGVKLAEHLMERDGQFALMVIQIDALAHATNEARMAA